MLTSHGIKTILWQVVDLSKGKVRLEDAQNSAAVAEMRVVQESYSIKGEIGVDEWSGGVEW